MLDNLAMIPVTARAHPLDMETVHAEFPHGLSIAEILGPDARCCRVEMGGMTLPEEWWAHIRPKPGVPVIIIRFPEGGGSVKSIFRIVAFAALAIGVAAITGGAAALGFINGAGLGGVLFGAGSISAGLLAATVGLVGSLVINALIPPTSPNTVGSASTDLLRSITGTSNQINRFGAIPCVIGTILAYPPLAALPVTELLGDDQYLRMLFDLGYGDPEVSDMKIGTTDLASYTDVQTEIGTDPTLFSQDIIEITAGQELDTDGNTGTRTSAANADELSIDLSFAAGLFGVDSNGNTITVTCMVRVEYAVTGSGSWQSVTAAGNLTVSNSAASANVDGTFHVVNGERKAIRIGLRWQPSAKAQYDVRVTRVSTNWGAAAADSQIGALTWTVIRTIRYDTVSTTGTKKLALRIKATDQLSGSINQFNCILAQPIPVWDPGTSTWLNEISDNCAFVYRWLLTGCPANPRLVDAGRIDDEELKEWAADCAAKEFGYNNVLDQVTTVFALLKDVCAAGRATFTIREGRYSVVRDIAQTTPIQVFTPRNSWGFTGSRAFPDIVHALRVQIVNPEAGYQQDEVVVYDDGYGSAEMIAAVQTNLFDKTTATAGKFVNAAGVIGDAYPYYSLSAAIPAAAAEQMVISQAIDGEYGNGYAWFAADGTTCVGGAGGTLEAYAPITAPAGAAFLRFSGPYLNLDTLMVFRSATAPTLPPSGYYAFGAGPAGMQLATKFEQLTLPGVTNVDAAWRLGRYHLAAGRLRPNTYFWNADIENLVCNRGDLVLVANDVIDVGQAWGRIAGVTHNGDGNVTGITTDEGLDVVGSTSYVIRVRRNDGTVALCPVTPPHLGKGLQSLTLNTPTPRINEGDLFVFGVPGQDTIPMIITKIEPAADLAAKITAVDAASAVLNADAGTPPPFVSQITGQPWMDAPPPPDLLIVDSGQLNSYPNDAGSTTATMSVTISGAWSGVVRPDAEYQ